MSTDFLDTVPSEHRDTARLSLTAAFGAAALGPLSPVSGGASGALIYRLEAAGRPYLMRIETRRDAFRNPHQYVCMQIAADAGIAPALYHLDAAAGVAIMDFLPQRPLTEYPGGPVNLAHDLGKLSARLQATPLFPELRDYLVILERLLGFLRGSFVPGVLDAHVAGFERIRDSYPWDPSALVSSHNDPNPRNVIFDGQRLWLIDWETAYRNDPLTDVAILAENFAASPDLEEALLRAWLGRAPDRAIHARLTLMRPLTRLYYACILLGVVAPGSRTAPDADVTAPSPAEFRAAIAEGRLKIGAPDTARTLGKMLLAGFRSGLAAPGFEEALAAVRQEEPSA